MATKFSWVSFWTGIKDKIRKRFAEPIAVAKAINDFSNSIQKEEPYFDRVDDKIKLWLAAKDQSVVERWTRDIKTHEAMKGNPGNGLQNYIANQLGSNTLPETKELLPSPSQKPTNTMFQKLKDDAQLLIVKIGLISHRLLNYILMAIAFGTNLLNLVSGPIGEIAIKDLLPAGTDPALLEDFIMGVTKAIGYLTQSQAILSAATPDQMLQLFLQDLKNDVPGLQKTKIFAFVWNLASHLDGNAKIPSVYSYLTSKYLLKTRLDAGVSPDTAIAATIPTPATS